MIRLARFFDHRRRRGICSTVGGLLLVVPGASAGGAPADEVEAVPLRAVWAWNMPATRAMEATRNGSNDRHVAPEGALLDGIRRTLGAMPGGPEGAACFVVEGAGMSALARAHGVLAEGEAPLRSLVTGRDYTMVFYSYPFGQYVHLERVEKSETGLRVRYRFVGHKTKEVTEHLALIPVGELRPGVFSADVKAVNESGWDERPVCRSFTLPVHSGARDDPPLNREDGGGN